MKYTGKYKKLAEQFRADGADEYTIEKWIRQEMEQDQFQRGEGTTDLVAFREWSSWPQERRDIYLSNAFCPKCRAESNGRTASFASGYNIRKDKYGLVIEGKCAKCGGTIVRICD